jgi:hypothetical protein
VVFRRIQFLLLTKPTPQTEAPTSGFFRKSSVGGAKPNISGLRKKGQKKSYLSSPAMSTKFNPKTQLHIAGKSVFWVPFLALKKVRVISGSKGESFGKEKLVFIDL